MYDITSFRGSLPNLFKLCFWDKNWPRPRGHQFTFNNTAELRYVEVVKLSVLKRMLTLKHPFNI